MFRSVLCLAGVLLVPATRADEPAPKLTQETWHAAYFEGVKAGHVHTTLQELKIDGVKVTRTTRNPYLNVRRYGKVVPLRLEMATDEKEDGKVVGLAMTQF